MCVCVCVCVKAALTWGLDIQPAGSSDLPAEEKVLQAGGVGAKHMGERRPLQVGGQSWRLSLQNKPS